MQPLVNLLPHAPAQQAVRGVINNGKGGRAKTLSCTRGQVFGVQLGTIFILLICWVPRPVHSSPPLCFQSDNSECDRGHVVFMFPKTPTRHLTDFMLIFVSVCGKHLPCIMIRLQLPAYLSAAVFPNWSGDVFCLSPLSTHRGCLNLYTYLTNYQSLVRITFFFFFFLEA